MKAHRSWLLSTTSWLAIGVAPRAAQPSPEEAILWLKSRVPDHWKRAHG
jgi:hypothetical protein